MSEIESFLNVMKALRSENGCPWDKSQTIESLKPCCIEEAAEIICGINVYEQTGNADNLKEELGDMLMVIALESGIAEQAGLFTFDDVVKGIKEKMIRRHPNVFGDTKNLDIEDQKILWDQIKKEEKKNRSELVDKMLPEAFEESKMLIERAKTRKGIA